MDDKLLPDHQPSRDHQLSKAPERADKRLRGDKPCDDEAADQPKKRKTNEVKEEIRDPNDIFCFEMVGFPPLMHPMTKYKLIMERAAYITIFSELMDKVKLFLDAESDANLVLTGNPGIRKSQFYLFCISRLIRQGGVEAKKLDPFEVVLNCGNNFKKYLPETREFVDLNDAAASSLKNKPRVLRLVEGDSTQLNGWSGVSVLFASPNLKGFASYKKVNSYTYIMSA